MALSAGDRLGSYEILGLLGAGGMGDVRRAHDTRFGREVAIRVLRSQVPQGHHPLAAPAGVTET